MIESGSQADPFTAADEILRMMLLNVISRSHSFGGFAKDAYTASSFQTMPENGF